MTCCSAPVHHRHGRWEPEYQHRRRGGRFNMLPAAPRTSSRRLRRKGSMPSSCTRSAGTGDDFHCPSRSPWRRLGHPADVDIDTTADDGTFDVTFESSLASTGSGPKRSSLSRASRTRSASRTTRTIRVRRASRRTSPSSMLRACRCARSSTRTTSTCSSSTTRTRTVPHECRDRRRIGRRHRRRVRRARGPAGWRLPGLGPGLERRRHAHAEAHDRRHPGDWT